MNKGQLPTRNIRKPGVVGNLNIITLTQNINGLIRRSFEIPASAYYHPLACIRMNILHKISILLILMIISSNDLSSQTVDSIPRLKIYASLNGYTSGNHSIDWYIQQNCLQLGIDTVLIVADKQKYIDCNLKRLKKLDKGLRRDEDLIKEHISRLSKDYDKYMPLDTYDYFSKGQIKGFKLSGNRCCFVTSADSKTNCLSESQISYLKCLLDGDWFWISDVKVLVADSLYEFNSAIQFEIENENLELQIVK